MEWWREKSMKIQESGTQRTWSTAMCRALVFCLFVSLTSGCISPRYFSNKAVNVSADPGWWGEVPTNRPLVLKMDCLMYREILEPGWMSLTAARYEQEIVTVENYESKRSRWPELELIPAGTRLRCVELYRYFSLEFSEYKVYADILDGKRKGTRVELGRMVTGDPADKGKGTLQVMPEFLEIVE
jgi:uncharacterized protein YbdZ (MbtH family)